MDVTSRHETETAAEPPIRWRRLFWPVLLAAAIFAASSQSELAGPPGIPHMDKIAHTAIFGLLATLVIRVFFAESRRVRSVLLAVVIVSAYGISDEIRQSFTPGRFVEFGDWAADTIGAILAAGCYGFWDGWRRLLEAGGRKRRGITTHAGDERDGAALAAVGAQEDEQR